MYSYEERRIAIELCCQYNGRVAAAVSALGYPSVKQLKRWRLHYLQTGKVPDPKQRRSRYTDNQKARAVRHYFATGQCVAHTRRSLGYPSLDLLRSWIDAASGQKTGPQPTTGRAVPFSHAEKQQAVVQLGSRDGSAATVAERIGVSRCTLYNWRGQLLDEKAKPTLKRSKDKPASGEAHALQETYRVQELLTAVNLPRSSYYYHREAFRRPDK